jgi:hypothetical protein
VVSYFIDAARESNLLNPDNSFTKIDDNNIDDGVNITGDVEENGSKQKSVSLIQKSKDNKNFSIKISGPGIQFEKQINSEDDFAIVDAILQNIQKQISQKSEIA